MSTQELAKISLENMPMCNMKNINAAQGLASLKDGVYKVVNTQTEKLYIFKSIDELWIAGWRVD